MNHLKAMTLILTVLVIPTLSAQITATIQDIQFVDPEGSSDISPLVGQEVITTGVVTASGEPDNLDAVYIQQEGLTEWAGLQLVSGPGLGSLAVGDLVTVRGVVSENFGMTVIQFVSEFTVDGASTIQPLELSPDLFTTPSIAINERYEGMLVELRNPNGQVAVVNVNPDEPSNFGEWRVGTDTLNTTEGCRILTGRQTSTITSSLNVSYVNNDVWESNSGTMNVPAIVVQYGDQFEGIRGVLNYSSSNFKLLPRNNDDVLLKTVAVTDVINEKFEVSVYPNPMRDAAYVQFELDQPSAIAITLYDMLGTRLGQLFHSSNLGPGRHKIPFEFALHPGTYLLSVGSDTQVNVVRMVKE